MKKATLRLLTLALLPAACLIAVLVAEGALRLVAPKSYYVWPPNLQMTFVPDSQAIPGVTGESKFVINDAGLRGRPFSQDDRYRVLAMGGSTTECLYLDEPEAWPNLLEAQLNAAFEPSPVWVGNSGKSGHQSAHHVLQAEHLLTQYPRIDLALLLVGTNDMMRVAQQSGFVPLSDTELQQAFTVWPGGASGTEAGYPWYKRTQLWRTLRAASQNLATDESDALVQDTVGSVFVTMRKKRQNAVEYTEQFPDLTEPLREYRANLHSIVDSAERHGTKLVLMTQPSLWADNLPDDAAQLIWMGRMAPYMTEAPQTYYTAGTLAKAMDAYNRALLEVCAERGLQCLDLAAAIPKESKYFYDDVHFTETGSRLVADVVARHLLSL
jgi:lysophospholipase L1-like esterase